MSLRLLILLLFVTLPAAAQLIREANTTMTFPADLPSATGYTTVNAFGTMTFTAPMMTAFPAGETNRVFVAERAGTIQCVHSLDAVPTKVGYLNLTSLLLSGETLRTDGENGLLALVFHPNFASNRTLYVYFSMEAGGTLFQRLHQVTVASASANTATIQQHKPILTILDRDTNHNGGDLAFGADGFLYLSLGDEGGGGDNRNNARFINTINVSGTRRTGFWGQLIRIAVEVDPVGQPGVFPAGTLLPNAAPQNSTVFPSSTHGNHRVPADNPFIGFTSWHNLPIDPATVRTEIYATGLRNPFRFNIDGPTQRIFLGDVGQGIWEEMDLIVKGGDYGWSWREGAHVYNSPPAPTTPPPVGFDPIDPIYEYDHTNDGVGNDAVIYGTVVIGGIIYRGNQLTELAGKLIFADTYGGGGLIAALTETSPGVWTGQRLTTRSQIVDFGLDPRDGEPLLTSLLGTVYKLARSGTSGPPPPATLSAAGVFSDLASLTPQPGIVSYAPNVDFWSDHAHKRRWFSIRNLTDTVAFSPAGNWTFPTGMVWVKHFDFDLTRGNPATRRKLETRVLVKTATDVYGLSYQWNNLGSGTQTDATLVAEAGASVVIPGASPAQTWRFPSRSECKSCHTPAGGFALSFHTRQMNRTNLFGAQNLNQISALSGAGYFSAPVSGVNLLPAYARADDASASLEWRVRSYLAVNCVQCHQPGGPALGNWDARSTVPTDAAGLINGALVNVFGDSANRWCVPGDPAHSMALQRIAGNGVPRMPPLGTSERDLTAEQLLTDWINTVLPARQSFAQWQVANFGSTTAPEAQPGFDGEGDGADNAEEFLRGTSPVVPNVPLAPVLSEVGGNFILQFTQPANRSVLVETTTDFATWSLWDVPGNAPSFPAANLPRTLIGPAAGPNQYFRLRLGEL
jgi:glucose/arabinose dehydrogenase